ncbi:MAG: thrombospondin type 3 repeat-containing protein [Salinivirgaceae bacterium]|jgi:hypothetical protein|nr:thrombospondin type 3 repeat-containing protein [Salinivirgaceae bacterium]
MKITNYIILLLLFLSASVLGQQRLSEEYETLLLEEEESTEGLAFKPIIGAGMGSFSFYGDVNDYFRTPLNGLTSYRLAISRNISKNFDIEFQGTFGNVSGNKYGGDSAQTLNFKTSVFLGGVSMYYNFNHLLKRQRPIHPYFSLGVEVLQFSPYGDLKAATGGEYHYWSDGTIRDIEQGVNGGGNLINRDYNYETDLRELNNDEYYSKTSFAIPIDIGVNVTVSDRVKCRLGATFHMSMTDYIDNLSKKGSGFSNDIILNTYLALSIDLFSLADELTAVDNFRSLKFTITDREDQDGDGIDDFNDECPDTPNTGVKVNYKGCPEDIDNDGVPDYLDKQNNTPVSTIAVGANGISLAETQLIMLLYDPDAVKRSEIELYSKTTEASTNDGKKGIPDKFKPVDVDENNEISHEELNNAIEAIFEGTSTFTPADINELQEFFFGQ